MRQFLSSVELPMTQPSPISTPPRRYAPGRSTVPCPTTAVPSITAVGAIFTSLPTRTPSKSREYPSAPSDKSRRIKSFIRGSSSHGYSMPSNRGEKRGGMLANRSEFFNISQSFIYKRHLSFRLDRHHAVLLRFTPA